MSTLSFQDYVRERMLKRRQAEIAAARRTWRPLPRLSAPAAPSRAAAPVAPMAPVASVAPGSHPASLPPMLREEIRYGDVPSLATGRRTAPTARAASRRCCTSCARSRA